MSEDTRDGEESKLGDSAGLPATGGARGARGVHGVHGVHRARSVGGVQLLGVDLNARWSQANPELRALAQGLHTELGAVSSGAPFPLPGRKARLTRRGGRCEADGTPLTFMPWQRDSHQCPTCHTVYRGLEHDDWWALGAQLWSAERTLHAAILGGMWKDHALLKVAQHALNTYSQRWETYPNRDNVLGPSRLFFSTYLESVWLLNTTLAAHVLRSYSDDPATGPNARAAARETVNRFVSRVVEPCRALIASYPEGLSNRQAWHTAALLSAASLLRDDAAVAPLVDGAQGVRTLINRGLLSDGTWYEGENYHLFAHRGLWYGVTLLESLGVSLPDATNARFALGFRTPFLGVLPDGTFPSRRDSRYAVSVHQWRFAEWCELGLQRNNDDLLRVWLHRLYSAAHSRGDTGRSRSTADIERDEPAQQLARQDLGWRTLLFARTAPWPGIVTAGEGSVMLAAQGLHVLRRDADRIYVAIEGGHTGGGHGHPDRLALTIQDGSTRILEDPGTGSYVDPSLHWYRSTLAHNAPLINGRSQRRVAAQCEAFEARSGVAWTRVRAEELAPGVQVRRSAVLLDEHVVDRVQWASQTDIVFDLPVHVDGGTTDAREWTARQPFASGGLEDGTGFVRNAECTALAAGELVCVERRADAGRAGQRDVATRSQRLDDSAPAGQCDEAAVRCWYALSGDGELWRATVPGPPGRGEQRMYWLRARGESGSMVGVWSLRGSVKAVDCAPVELGVTAATNSGELLPVQVMMRNGTTAVHAPAPHGWHVDLTAGSARSSLDLQGLQLPEGPQDESAHASASTTQLLTGTELLLEHQHSRHFKLDEQHYRRSELSWSEAGCPTADIALKPDGAMLHIFVSAHTGAVVVPESDAINVLDNERVDVNADGLQLYVAPLHASDWTGAWLIVPHALGPRVTSLAAGADDRLSGLPDGAESTRALSVQSQHTDTGWTMQLTLRLDAYGLSPDKPFRFDLIVNERPPERERRRGQLLMSGAEGEFVYLRGDRHDLLRSWVLHVVPSRASHTPHASRSHSQPPV